MAKLQRTTRGTIILPNKERITPSEQKRLINAVRRANRERGKDIERLNKIKSNVRYNRFGVESDFLLRKKNTSFTKFRNKNEFKRYLRSAERQASGATSLHRIRVYKQNYETSLRKAFNSSANHAIKLLRQIDGLALRDAHEAGQLEQIGYIYYDPEMNKLQLIEAQLQAILDKQTK